MELKKKSPKIIIPKNSHQNPLKKNIPQKNLKKNYQKKSQKKYIKKNPKKNPQKIQKKYQKILLKKCDAGHRPKSVTPDTEQKVWHRTPEKKNQ